MPWFLLSALAAGGTAAAGAWFYIRKLNALKQELADFIIANPQSAALVVCTFDENGELVEDERSLFHCADEPFILASTMKIMVLAAYASAVAEGNLDPAERVPVTDWERYYLPGSDGGAHVAGLKRLGLAADQHGFARDQAATVSLDDLAANMIYDSGNASTDYLLERVTTERMAAVIQEAGLAQHTPIRPTLGLVLAMFNHDNPPTTAGQLLPMLAALASGNATYVDQLTELYLHNPDWRAAQIQFMTSNQIVASLPPEEIWGYQQTAGQLFAKATAREYAGLMARIASGRLFSAEVSHLMQGKLESVPSDWPLRLLFYGRLGAKDGSTAGVLTLASYAVPRRGRLAGQSRVIVILVNNLPAEIWSAQLSYQGHYLLQTDLARVSGVFTRLAAG